METQELDLVGGKLNTTTVSEALGKDSWTAILGQANVQDAVTMALRSPRFLAKVRSVADQVAKHAASLTYEQFKNAMLPLAMYAPPTDVPDAKSHPDAAAMWWRMGWQALRDMPLESLEFAVSEYIRTSTYRTFPAWGALRKIGEPKATEIRTVAWRVRKMVEAKPFEPRPERTADEKKAVQRMLEEFKAGKRPMNPLAPKESAAAMASRLRAIA